MRGVLFDTHVVVWILLGEARLSPAVTKAIDESDVFYVSAASVYEIAFKRQRALRRGAQDALTALPDDFAALLRAEHFTIVDVTSAQAYAAGVLPMTHGDPFDRILVAQARDLGVALVTGDQALRDQAGDTPLIW